jgi:hypothetical protein
LTRREEQLRAEAKSIRKNLTRKISRIASVNNVNIANTSLDPRLPASAINSMNTRQLNSYLKTARGFLSRDVGFVRGKGGVPLPRSEWNALAATVRANNKFAERRLSKYSDITVPGSRNTIGEREGIRSRMPRMRNTASNRPVDQINIEDAEGFGTVQQMRRMRKKIEQRMTEKHLNKSIKKTRATATKAWRLIGDKRVQSWIRNMSDEMLDVLWNYGGLAESTFSRYNNMHSMAFTVEDARGFEKVASDAESDIEETIKWAATFDKFKK